MDWKVLAVFGLIMLVILASRQYAPLQYTPSAAFIDFTVPFAYEKSISTSARCSNKASVGVNNPTLAGVESSTVVITIAQVDNSINNMHIGSQRTTEPEIIQTTDCEVYNSACTNSPVTAFRSPAWSDLGSGIDGTCSYAFNVKFRQPVNNTSPEIPSDGLPSTPLPPSDRVFVLSDVVDIFKAIFAGIQDFIGRIF